jgi:hypothetical protein
MTSRSDSVVVAENWPPEVDLIASALEAGGHLDTDRRRGARMHYRVLARLFLYSDPADADPWILYTRDVNSRSLGFISAHRLPLGYGGTIELSAPRDGEILSIACTLLRCREAAPGWFEGALYFNREQSAFAVESNSND